MREKRQTMSLLQTHLLLSYKTSKVKKKVIKGNEFVELEFRGGNYGSRKRWPQNVPNNRIKEDVRGT